MLQSGARLGPYEIVNRLGAGGMGEVYRARDTRLDRTVALKVLGPELAADANARARFEREARAIAALSHPHICTVHDVGREGDVDYIVMEYVEGETLADRLARTRGPIPFKQALKIGIDIAAALDKAHRAGIVHRDLKPGNIMLTRASAGRTSTPDAKLLDFGLAKLLRPLGPLGMSAMARETTATPATAEGTILGTIHYMAPEQVEGREADKRCDLWALGAVLYEMVTGVRAFDGPSAASVIGSILKDTPAPVSSRTPLAPPAFDYVIERCLEKDPDERWQDAGDIRRQLEWIARARQPGADPLVGAATRRPLIPWMVAGAALLVAAVAGAELLRERPAVAIAPKMAFSIVPPDQVRFGGSFALSADGRRFVFVGLGPEGPAALWIRALDSLGVQQLPGSEDASFPFWSPNGDAVAFFANGMLKTMPIVGGVPKIVAPAPNGRGGTWGADGTILFVPEPGSVVSRVADTGGAVAPATALDPAARHIGHRWPSFVDARHFVYSAYGPADASGIYLASLDSKDVTRLVGALSNSAMVDGHLMFGLAGQLVVQPLDLAGRRLVGRVIEIAGPAAFIGGLGYEPFSVASNGVLAYINGQGAIATSDMRWFDRQGKPQGPLARGDDLPQYNSYSQRLSPDGRMLAFSAFRTATADLWLVDMTREVSSRFTFDDASELNPVWSPDGMQLLFTSNRRGVYSLYRRAVSLAGDEALLFESAAPQWSTDWSQDGRTILFTTMDPKTQTDLWMAPMHGDRKAAPVLATPFNEYGGRFSPDGRWIAYTSDGSGRPEVYVQRFPSGTDKLQISTQGGSEPQWRGDGRELFFVAANRTLTSVSTTLAPAFTAARPTKLFDTLVDTSLGTIHSSHYAPTADGQRFLVNVSALSDAPTTVVLNWISALNKSDAVR